MSRFLDKYVRAPIQGLLTQVGDQLPELTARHGNSFIDISVGGELLHIERNNEPEDEAESGEMPEDAANDIVDS